ncbi:MAG: rhomboid family intramembrane serine protease [Lachnospiraceae bacterium]|nr:rhomboid family intramembrane serine protease [Lachnospiraceae bacterium]
MQTIDVVKQFQKEGYQRAVVNGLYVDVLLQFKEACTYVVVVFDCNHLNNLTLEKYESIMRAIRSSIYSYEFNQIHTLHVLCTNEPNQTKELIGAFGEHWIVDLKEQRLLIYENQLADFSDAKQIIERTLSETEEDIIEQKRQEKIKYIKENICTIGLVLINIIIFLLVEITGSTMNTEHMVECGALSMDRIGEKFWQYRLFSSMFLHFGIEHLGSNLLMLAVMGSYIEKRMGRKAFLAMYFGAGIIGNIASLYYYINSGMSNVVTAGASGAVFGMIGALLYLIIKNRGRLAGLSYGQIAVILLLSYYQGLVDTQVNMVAHYAGFVGGFILSIILGFLNLSERKA